MRYLFGPLHRASFHVLQAHPGGSVMQALEGYLKERRDPRTLRYRCIGLRREHAQAIRQGPQDNKTRGRDTLHTDEPMRRWNRRVRQAEQ